MYEVLPNLVKRTPDNKPLSCLICISWQSDKSMFIWHQSLGQPGVNCLGWINNDGLVSELQSFLTWLFVMENVIGILWRDQGQEWWIRHLTTVPDLSIPDCWIRIKHFQSLWLTGGHSLLWYSWIFILDAWCQWAQRQDWPCLWFVTEGGFV